MKIILITGGQSCGKSTYAENRSLSFNGKRAFLATAQAFDQEMKEKIKNHQLTRGNNFYTYEEPLNLTSKIKDIQKDNYEVLLLDCLTMWVSNLLLKHENEDKSIIENEFEKFKNFLIKLKEESHIKEIIIVTNETGWGIIPDNKLARKYIIFLGRLNKMIAEISDEVFLMVSGIEVKIK